MSTRDNRNVSGVAREIQERLRAARAPAQPEANAAAAEQQAPEAANDHHRRRVTKDGQLVEPGEQVPTGENGQPVSFSSLPAATFHAAEHP